MTEFRNFGTPLTTFERRYLLQIWHRYRGRTPNRKPYTIYRMIPLSMTLSDLALTPISRSWNFLKTNIVKTARLKDKVTIYIAHNRKLYMLHVEWYHVCWPRLTAKRVEPVVSISWASCLKPTSTALLWNHLPPDICYLLLSDSFKSELSNINLGSDHAPSSISLHCTILTFSHCATYLNTWSEPAARYYSTIELALVLEDEDKDVQS